MKLLLSSLFTFLTFITYAQVGLSLKYNSNTATGWNDNFYEIEQIENGTAFDQGYEIGINYRYRMKKVHIDLLPEVSFAKSPTDSYGYLASPDRTYKTDFDLSTWNFMLNTNVYFLDIEGGCDCPTFGSDPNAIAKGLHLILTPALSRNINRYSMENPADANAPIERSFAENNFRFGVGMGLDMGFTEKFLATIFVIYHYTPSVSSDFINDHRNEAFGQDFSDIESTELRQLQVGVRFAIQ